MYSFHYISLKPYIYLYELIKYTYGFFHLGN